MRKLTPSDAILLALLAFIAALIFACRQGGVDTSPYVEYDRRIENNHGEGMRLGVSFSPSPEPLKWAPAPLPEPIPPLIQPPPLQPPAFVCSACEKLALKDAETQKLTFETPWGLITFTLGSSMVALLGLLFAQKRGWIPSPTPKPKEESTE